MVKAAEHSNPRDLALIKAPTLLSMKISQTDCPVSQISLMSRTRIAVLASFRIESDPPTLKRVLLAIPGDVKWKEVSKEILPGLPGRPVVSFTLVRSGESEKIIEIAVKDTEMGKFYWGLQGKRVRLFPTIVENGVETWTFLCEDPADASDLVHSVSLGQTTTLVSSSVLEKIPVSAFSLNPNIVFFLNRIESDAMYNTLRKNEILMTIAKSGYYSDGANVKLSDLARRLGVSKSYVSKLLRNEEKKVMRTYLSALLNYL
ncbi:MAG TPA: helix-turn-helix domain-containing protein [Thermoplasmataceae archaeon]|nr:helix-turn-helix domain-containing protein [Thermoplasmataceae archaeon]